MSSESEELLIEDSDESLLDLREINDLEFDIPHVAPPSLESILWDMESEEGNDSISLLSFQSISNKGHSMLYHCILQGISTQISSAVERVDAGLPSVITNSTKYIAIGTSHGYILAFDSEQNLCWCCHDTDIIDQGAVSALSFNMESTRLLIGYERGYISMVNATCGDVLRRLPDAHAPQTAVLYLRFSFLNNLALCGDSSGCVFSLFFNRRLGVRSWDSKCLFSGARGEVCIFEPLLRGYDINFLNRHVLVAMATLSKVIVISVRPKLKVHFSQQLPRISTSLPLISWQVVSVGKSFQPVLAWGRGNELNYTRVITHGYNNNRIRLLPLRNVQLPYTMTALHWLGTRHLAILDTSENLRLVEVRTQRELETLDVTSAGLVYNSAHFKALAVGGGVSEAFALAGERACYNSLSSRGDQLLLLGTKTVHLVRLRSWPERLFHLGEQGRWTEALHLACGEESSGAGSIREKYAITLLRKYLEEIQGSVFIDKESLTAAVACCIRIGKSDILCNELFDTISTIHTSQEWYFSLLTDHVCSGNLTNLSPVVAQRLVNYLENKDQQSLEKVLLSLDVACLDLHQVLKICKQQKLYNAWIHITTRTLGDYTSPLIELIGDLTPQNHRLGNIMLVYVSSCLTGLGYPTGNIPEENISRVRNDVLRCLETAHSPNGSQDESAYPYLRALLRYNTREFLNVIELAFAEAAEFSGEMGLLQRRRLIEILMRIVTSNDFQESKIVNLACFISRLVVTNNIEIDEKMLATVIKFLTINASLSLRDRMEREQALLDLLNANKLNYLKAGELIKMSLDARCYRVVEYLYEVQRNYSNLLSCYLNDSLRKNEVFNYILNYINVNERCIQQQFLVYFKELVTVSNKKTAEIVSEYFPDLIVQLCDILNDDSELQYKFLNEIVNTEIKLPPELAETYLRQLCVTNRSEVCFYIQSSSCRSEESLKITKEYGVHEATALLLEQSGEWMEALELLLQHCDLIDKAVSLCIRGVDHLDIEGSKKLWLTLLQNKKNTSGVSLRYLLHAAAPHIPPSELLDLVSNAHFGDVKGLLQGMLNDYKHDIEMLSTTFKLLGKDLHHNLARSLSKSGKGTSVVNLVCGLCQKSLIFQKELGKNEQSLVWRCGHCFHMNCIKMLEVTNACPHCRLKAVLLSITKKKSITQNQDTIQLRPDLEGIF